MEKNPKQPQKEPAVLAQSSSLNVFQDESPCRSGM